MLYRSQLTGAAMFVKAFSPFGDKELYDLVGGDTEVYRTLTNVKYTFYRGAIFLLFNAVNHAAE